MYQNIKQSYMHLKDFVEKNESKYHNAEKIVTDGITDNQGLSLEVLDKMYASASFFYMQYELAKAIVQECEDLGLHLVTKDLN